MTDRGPGLAGRRTELRVVTTAPTGDADLAALLVVGEGGVSNSRLVAAAMTAAVEATTVLDGGCLPLCEAPSSARSAR